jgi:hypothetical protein
VRGTPAGRAALRSVLRDSRRTVALLHSNWLVF